MVDFLEAWIIIGNFGEVFGAGLLDDDGVGLALSGGRSLGWFGVGVGTLLGACCRLGAIGRLSYGIFVFISVVGIGLGWWLYGGCVSVRHSGSKGWVIRTHRCGEGMMMNTVGAACAVAVDVAIGSVDAVGRVLGVRQQARPQEVGVSIA